MVLSSSLYRWARLVRDLEVLLSGNPNKIAKRLVNKVIGRRVVSKMWIK